jgi:hypothetical protein
LRNSSGPCYGNERRLVWNLPGRMDGSAGAVRSYRLSSRPRSLAWFPEVKRPRLMPPGYSKSIPPRYRVYYPKPVWRMIGRRRLARGRRLPYANPPERALLQRAIQTPRSGPMTQLSRVTPRNVGQHGTTAATTMEKFVNENGARAAANLTRTRLGSRLTRSRQCRKVRRPHPFWREAER